TQNSVDIEDSSETGDSLGAALAVGDLNGDGDADLAAGAPGEGVGTAAGAGAVNVIYGSGGGLTAAGNQLWT
ncbi:FG-GAP repeat protein, partial [Escherichia coli]